MTLKIIAAAAPVAALLAAADLQPVNDLPNPFRTIRDWAQPPQGKWAAVTAVEVAPNGSVFVIHRCHDNSCIGRGEPPILKFGKNGKLLASWGAGVFNFPPGVTGSQPGLFDEPTDVAIAANGDIFVTEGHVGGTPGNHRVSKFSKDGKFLMSWGHEGQGPGEFENPHTIAIDSRGRVFVGDRSNNRIQIFDQAGKFLQEWRQFGRPSGIFIAKDDTMYVADSESWGPDEPGWKKGIRVGSAKDGSVQYFIEDLESTTTEHSGAEGVGVDAAGNVYGAVVRRQMLEKHIRAAK